MALDWGVYGLPETFILGPDGTVLLRVAGPLTQRNIETRVLPALKAAGISFPTLNLRKISIIKTLYRGFKLEAVYFDICWACGRLPTIVQGVGGLLCYLQCQEYY